MTKTIGFTGYEWKKPFRRCAKCSRKILRGVINIFYIGKELEPNFKVLCWDCFHELPATPVEAAPGTPLGDFGNAQEN